MKISDLVINIVNCNRVISMSWQKDNFLKSKLFYKYVTHLIWNYIVFCHCTTYVIRIWVFNLQFFSICILNCFSWFVCLFCTVYYSPTNLCYNIYNFEVPTVVIKRLWREIELRLLGSCLILLSGPLAINSWEVMASMSL